GEVNLDDLLVYSAIHTVSSRGIAFIRDHWHFLASVSETDNGMNRKEAIDASWNARMSGLSDGDKKWLWVLLQDLFPGLEIPGLPKAQGISKERYWGRIANGRIEREGVRDQKVIKDVKTWKETGDASAVVEQLMTDSEYTKVFESLFEYGTPTQITVRSEDILTLASRLFEEMRGKFGVQAKSDCCPGFIALWRLQSRGRRYRDYESWVWSEMQRTLPVSLLMSNDLEYYWASRKYSHLKEDEIGRIRQRTAE
ncbi:unnamed protein product, partial [marine sediment metagenome]